MILVSSGLALARTDSPDKVAVVDGRYVHRVGELWHHVTNWGMVGSAPSVPTTFSDAPSAMWPGGSGNEYLWAAGIWVGGRVLGEELVSTGSFSTEFLPTDAPGDTIHTTVAGAPGGARFPWPGADDDGDGLEDEDILNGLDDDNDGLIDEDFAAISDQHFLCSYTDFEAAIMENNPDHTPLNLKISQQSMQWSHDLYDDFVGYDFTITNVGVVAIEDVYLGMFSDFDIGPRGLSNIASDDYAGFVSEMAELSDGSQYPLNISYMYDNPEGPAHIDGYVGWVLLGHPTDPAGQAAPVEIGVRSYQRYSGMASYQYGGDPTNDTERYHSLSVDQWDSNALPGMANDYRTLMSSGPFTTLEPGESLTFQVALVLGAGLEEMKANAVGALETYLGRDFDRDGDPSNGAEYTVNWICPADEVVAAHSGHIMAQTVAGGVELLIESNLPGGSNMMLVRHGSDGSAGHTWPSDQWQTLGTSGLETRYRVLDTDQVNGPRVYELVFEMDGQTQTLDQTSMDVPDQPALQMSASPNPFNPQVNLRLSVPDSEQALLQIFDLRGRLVTTLWDGPFTAAGNTVSWHGTDSNGRNQPSGVYEVRLVTDTGVLHERVTLLR